MINFRNLNVDTAYGREDGSQRLFINLVLHRHVCIVFFAQLTNSNVLGKLPIRDANKVNSKLLLVDLAKIQYTRDGEGPYL